MVSFRFLGRHERGATNVPNVRRPATTSRERFSAVTPKCSSVQLTGTSGGASIAVVNEGTGGRLSSAPWPDAAVSARDCDASADGPSGTGNELAHGASASETHHNRTKQRGKIRARARVRVRERVM